VGGAAQLCYQGLSGLNAARKKRWKEVATGLSRRFCFPSGYLGLRHPFCGSLQTVMLLYHRVVPRAALPSICSLPQIVTPLEDFEEQLDFLASQYHILSLGEFGRVRQERRAMPLKTVVITFDDGWEDNYAHAFPALKRRGIPATIFLGTAYIGTAQAFWQEQLLHLIQVWRQRVQSGEIKAADARQLPPALSSVFLSSGVDRATLRLVEDLKTANEGTRSELREALAGILGHPSFPFRDNAFLNWNQVRDMHASGIEFGSHARSHRLLPSLSPSEIVGEVRESKGQIEDMLGGPVTSFAYPNGNYDATVIEALKTSGYRLAATTRKGINTAWTNPFELRRMNVNGGLFAGSNGHFSSDLFAFKLTGLR
jgi:peptidoglycan/xylan/chitin deacetylase (PgdA/CDA1 family)